MTPLTLESRLETVLGQPVLCKSALSGGCVGEVYKVTLANGKVVVVKVDESAQADALALEGWMLTYLKDHSALPVPDVLVATPQLLVMSFLAGQTDFPASVQAHAADLLAALHGIRGPYYGLERDTLIGGLHQPNTPTKAWLPFFRDQRILAMAQRAHGAGSLDTAMLARLERFCDRLDDWLFEPPYPALLHGDVWSGNVLSHQGKVTGFIDPAIYYGHPEIELAFSTLFGTFGDPFFKRYAEHMPLAPGFFECRRDLYNLYPLLVHVNLFGPSYLGSVDRILKQIGL